MNKRKLTIILILILSLAIIAGALYFLNQKFHFLANGTSTVSGNYDSEKYVTDSTNFHRAINGVLPSGKLVIANAGIYKPLRSANAGILFAEDFAATNYDTGLGTLNGYTSGFGLHGTTFDTASSIVVRLYAVNNQLLQTNTVTPKVLTLVEAKDITSPFDVFGTFDYVTDGYWVNVKEIEYGQNITAIKAVATVTLADGTVVTSDNTIPIDGTKAQVDTGVADGFMAENEITPTVESTYETPGYVMARFNKNSEFCQAGKSVIMDADLDLVRDSNTTDNEYSEKLNTNKSYALSMYYLSSNNCTVLSWPWWGFDDAIARDIGDPISDPSLIDATHEVFVRDYTNATVLARPDFSANTETGDFVYMLSSQMQILNSDNTLSDPVSSVTLKRHQGVILIKDPNFVRNKTVNEDCNLCKAVGINRLFPHILTYSHLRESAPAWVSQVDIDASKIAAPSRFDITTSRTDKVNLSLTYLSLSDKQAITSNVLQFLDLAKFSITKNTNLANSFIYYSQNVPLVGGSLSLYSPRDQLEDKFAKIVQETAGLATDISGEAYGNKLTQVLNPSDPKKYDIRVGSAVGDSIDIGNFWKFGEINLNILTSKTVDEGVNVKYYDQDGSWKSLPLSSDTTNNFSQSGKLIFDPPATWQRNTIGSDSLYWVRLECVSVAQGGNALTLESVANQWENYRWDGVSAISGEKYPIINSQKFIPGWNKDNDLNKDGIIDNNETLDPLASAKYRYMARVPSYYMGNRWVMNEGDLTYSEFSKEQAVNLSQDVGTDGLFIDNVWSYIPDPWSGGKNYFVGIFEQVALPAILIESINIAEDQAVTANPYIISVKVIDPTKVAKVEYFIDDILIGTTTLPTVSGAFDCPWDTSKYHSVVKIIVYGMDGTAEEITRNTTVNLSGAQDNNDNIVVVLPKTGEEGLKNKLVNFLDKIKESFEL